VTAHDHRICRLERELARHPARSLEAMILEAEIRDLAPREWQLAQDRAAAAAYSRQRPRRGCPAEESHAV
jgi:hypothetical protein